jgi:hypothetical protein
VDRENWGIGAAVKQWGWETENTEEENGSFFYAKIVVKSVEGVCKQSNQQIRVGAEMRYGFALAQQENAGFGKKQCRWAEGG